MTTISDLPEDVVEEILPRVPLTSLSAVRSTCKTWNTLSKNRVLCKAVVKKQFLGFIMMDYRVCSMKFHLRNDEGGDLVDDLSIKQVGILDQIEISEVLHCDGLLLCVTKDNSSLVVWNPYLGQTRLIQPSNNFHCSDRYAIGYDNNRNLKILRIFGDYGSSGYEIYNFRSNSWKSFDLTSDWYIGSNKRGVSFKGNTYILAQGKIRVDSRWKIEAILLSFDFTTERFGPRLQLPFGFYYPQDLFSLSCVREEQLVVLHQSWMVSGELEIWITNKIDPGVVSWTKFLRSISCCRISIQAGSFFIDEENQVAVVFDLDEYKGSETCRNQTAHIIGQDEYFKSVNIGEAPNLGKPEKYAPRIYCRPLVCSSYVPSLVPLQINQPDTRKESDD